MIRIVLSTLGLLLISTSTAAAQARVTLEKKQYKTEERINARVENTGTQPVTICIEVGRWSLNKGKVEATPTPFWVEQRTAGKWHMLLLGPDVGSYLHAEVLDGGKSLQFPFRLGSPGTMRLKFNYWPGSKPNLECKAQPKGANQATSPTFTVE